MVPHSEVQARVLLQARNLRLYSIELLFKSGNAPTLQGDRISFLGCHSAPQGMRQYQLSPDGEQMLLGLPLDVGVPPRFDHFCVAWKHTQQNGPVC